MDRIEGVHLKGKDGKTYFIPAKALEVFEEPPGAGGELQKTGVELEAHEGSHPKDGKFRHSMAATFGVF